jgi:hypothetical protein
LFDLSNTPVMTSVWAILSFSKKEPAGKSWVNGTLTSNSQIMKEQMLTQLQFWKFHLNYQSFVGSFMKPIGSFTHYYIHI